MAVLEDWRLDDETGQASGIIYGHPTIPDGTEHKFHALEIDANGVFFAHVDMFNITPIQLNAKPREDAENQLAALSLTRAFHNVTKLSPTEQMELNAQTARGYITHWEHRGKDGLGQTLLKGTLYDLSNTTPSQNGKDLIIAIRGKDQYGNLVDQHGNLIVLGGSAAINPGHEINDLLKSQLSEVTTNDIKLFKGTGAASPPAATHQGLGPGAPMN